jgi:hypothetical protein
MMSWAHDGATDRPGLSLRGPGLSPPSRRLGEVGRDARQRQKQFKKKRAIRGGCGHEGVAYFEDSARARARARRPADMPVEVVWFSSDLYLFRLGDADLGIYLPFPTGLLPCGSVAPPVELLTCRVVRRCLIVLLHCGGMWCIVLHC